MASLPERKIGRIPGLHAKHRARTFWTSSALQARFGINPGESWKDTAYWAVDTALYVILEAYDSPRVRRTAGVAAGAGIALAVYLVNRRRRS